MLKGYSIYACLDGSYWNLEEDHGRSWNGIETCGIIWKPLENARSFYR